MMTNVTSLYDKIVITKVLCSEAMCTVYIEKRHDHHISNIHVQEIRIRLHTLLSLACTLWLV